MKTAHQLAVLLSLAAFAASAFADSPEQAYLESCRKDPGLPVPITVVTPRIAPGYGGSAVKVEFVVDANGQPTQISVKSSPDNTVAENVVEAVKQWRFTPAQRNGAPVAIKVVLPVVIVDDALSGARYAAK